MTHQYRRETVSLNGTIFYVYFLLRGREATSNQRDEGSYRETRHAATLSSSEL